MNTHDIDIELPPLPEALLKSYIVCANGQEMRIRSYDKDDMQAYALSAIEADRKRQGDSAKVLAELVALIPPADTLNASASCQDLIDYFKGLMADRKRRGEPSGYAYRYRHYDGETVIRFNDGCEVNGSRPIDTLPYWFAPQPAEPVAYLDLGVGGYMDLGSDLTDEQLAALPKGRHMLAIVGTYGVDGYTEVAPQPAAPAEAPNLQPTPSSAIDYKELFEQLADRFEAQAKKLEEAQEKSRTLGARVDKLQEHRLQIVQILCQSYS